MRRAIKKWVFPFETGVPDEKWNCSEIFLLRSKGSTKRRLLCVHILFVYRHNECNAIIENPIGPATTNRCRTNELEWCLVRSLRRVDFFKHSSWLEGDSERINKIVHGLTRQVVYLNRVQCVGSEFYVNLQECVVLVDEYESVKETRGTIHFIKEKI